jgi:hypothetical protein
MSLARASQHHVPAPAVQGLRASQAARPYSKRSMRAACMVSTEVPDLGQKFGLTSKYFSMMTDSGHPVHIVGVDHMEHQYELGVFAFARSSVLFRRMHRRADAPAAHHPILAHWGMWCRARTRLSWRRADWARSGSASRPVLAWLALCKQRPRAR